MPLLRRYLRGNKKRKKIKQIPMSASSATIKSEILAKDAREQLDAATQSPACIPLDIDESTDVNDNQAFLCM